MKPVIRPIMIPKRPTFSRYYRDKVPRHYTHTTALVNKSEREVPPDEAAVN